MALWIDRGTGFEAARLACVDHASDAFLCCPGPSLAEVTTDLRGPNRIIYALNTAYPHVKPDVWIGTDRTACFDRRLWFEGFPKIARLYVDDTDVWKHCPSVYYADTDEAADPAAIFLRRDHDVRFVWPKNSFIFALHFIIWSGAKRIHFVGCDMGGPTDYHDARALTDDQRANNRRLYAAETDTLARLAPLARRHGIEFLSATPNSPLNSFLAFVALDDAISACTAAAPDPGDLLHSQAVSS